MTSVLRYHLSRPTPALEAAVAWIAEMLGVRAMPSQPPDLTAGPHLVHGAPRLVGALGIAIPLRPADRFWSDLLDRSEPPTIAGELPFDLLSAIDAFLRDLDDGAHPPEDLDGHGRLPFAASLPARAGYGAIPVVNVYVEFLATILARHGLRGEPRWPAGQRAAIGLSHDVDSPERYALLQSAWRPWRLRRKPTAYARAIVRQVKQRFRDPDPNSSWRFDELAAFERELGVRSTFLFAVTPFHRRGAGLVDVAYDVRRQRYRRLVRRLVADRFEIGLHAGYNAGSSTGRLAAERRLLSRIAGGPIRGLRHHYWHLGPDVGATLRRHEEAGFSYDSSLAFNDRPGFRRAVALPFRPFDETLGRPLRTIQLPTFCMDGSLFYWSSDVEAAVDTVIRHVDVIEATGGLGVLNWHAESSVPGRPDRRAWADGYQEILRRLTARSGLWLTGLGEISTWVEERGRRLGHEPQPVASPSLQGSGR